jgi:hypothetical protein
LTKKFDDDARATLVNRFNSEDYHYNGIPVKEMVVKQITCKEARPYIAAFHYSKTMPDSTKFVYAGYYGDRLCGIVTYGMGAGKSQYSSVVPTIQNGEYVELTRLWCAQDMPKNTESKLIATSLKMLPTEIKLIISFADASKEHVGTIYQATNWHYLGINKGGKTLICEDGIVKHTRLLGIYKKRHPELKALSNEEIMKMYGWKYGIGGEKHRYVFVRGTKKEKKETLKHFEDKIQDYPKLEVSEKKKLSEYEIVKSDLPELVACKDCKFYTGICENEETQETHTLEIDGCTLGKRR